MTSTLYAMSASAKSEAERNRLASLALQYTETNKARQFSDSWGRSFSAALRRALPADLQREEHTLLVKRDQLRDEGRVNPAVAKELDRFVEDLRRRNPKYAAVAYPQEVVLESLPLRKDEVFVELKVTDESTLIWIAKGSTGNRAELLNFYQVPKSRQWFEDRVSKLRTALNSARPGQIDWRNSEELFAALFPGLLSKTLLESKSIVFVPDDMLSVLPFEMLSPDASKGSFPFLGLATSYYPSAAALRLSRTAGHSGNWQEAFLGIGDPITSPEDNRYEVASVLSPKRGPLSIPNDDESELDAQTVEKIKSRGLSFERLPGTATEVQEIAKLFEKSGQTAEFRLGSDATKGKLADTDLTRFRFLHFATHGLLPVNSNIKEPALVLSYDGIAPEHMLLSLSEILGFKIQADTVVLSACNTGNGALSRTEGVMSLGSAFMAAGAASVTVSLWQVSDASTQILMEQYYENILNGKSKSEALAAARKYLFTHGFSNPFFWDPFVLIGD
jgi:CHAT domain-containing protein